MYIYYANFYAKLAILQKEKKKTVKKFCKQFFSLIPSVKSKYFQLIIN